jgi:hypothetical protein
MRIQKFLEEVLLVGQRELDKVPIPVSCHSCVGCVKNFEKKKKAALFQSIADSFQSFWGCCR